MKNKRAVGETEAEALNKSTLANFKKDKGVSFKEMSTKFKHRNCVKSGWILKHQSALVSQTFANGMQDVWQVKVNNLADPSRKRYWCVFDLEDNRISYF